MDHLGSEEDSSTLLDVAGPGLQPDVRLSKRMRPKLEALARAYNPSTHTGEPKAAGEWHEFTVSLVYMVRACLKTHMHKKVRPKSSGCYIPAQKGKVNLSAQSFAYSQHKAD